jgi:hypothetical protein
MLRPTIQMRVLRSKAVGVNPAHLQPPETPYLFLSYLSTSLLCAHLWTASDLLKGHSYQHRLPRAEEPNESIRSLFSLFSRFINSLKISI